MIKKFLKSRFSNSKSHKAVKLTHVLASEKANKTWKFESDVSKSSKNYWIAGIPTAQKHDLGSRLVPYSNLINFCHRKSVHGKADYGHFQKQKLFGLFNTSFSNLPFFTKLSLPSFWRGLERFCPLFHKKR